MDVRRLVALAVTLPLLALGACTDEGSGDEPSPSPSPTSASPSPTATGPSIPPEARGNDEKSAKAFIKYYFEVFSAAMLSGDTADFETLALPRCRTCRNYTGLIRDTYDKGGHYETKGWAVEVAASLKWPGDRKGFVLRTRQHTRTLIDRNNKVIDRHESSLTAMRIIVRQRANAWRVERLDVIR